MDASPKYIFINSHPVQYFAPLYQYLAERGMDLEVWYASDENVKGHLDQQFGAFVAWDIPILSGYAHRFFRNRSWRPSVFSGFFGLINPSLWRALFKVPGQCIVVVHGWAYLTHVVAIVAAKAAGHVVCLRGENPLSHERFRAAWTRAIKKVLYGGLLFRMANHLLYIGSENRKYYGYYGVAPAKLVFAPYAVDNARFRNGDIGRQEARRLLNLAPVTKVVLSSGKYIAKKRPMDILKAFHALNDQQLLLIMVGDGALRPEMEAYLEANGISNCILTGFINQSSITRYYAAADIFVMASGEGETWGLSVNEAMNFNLPVVVSDRCGCAADLVDNGKNGFTFECGNVHQLTAAMRQALDITQCTSKETVDRYSFAAIEAGLRRIGQKDSQP